MTIQLQSWMLPAAMMCIGFLILAFSPPPNRLGLPSEQTLLGLAFILLGFAVLLGVFLP